MDFSLFQGELPIAIVQEHEVSSNVIGYREYGKTWFLLLEKLCSVKWSQKIFWDKYTFAVIWKSKVAGHLMTGKNGNSAKTLFFFRELVQSTQLK